MAFFRFSRDKRGYENFYLVQPTTNRRGKVRTRVLYWFRTPPDVRVGREPFDESVRRALEAQNPDVTFDWPSILEAPIPSADADKWRERRRAERAARQDAAVSADVDVADEPAEPREPGQDRAAQPIAIHADAAETAAAEATTAPPVAAPPDAIRKRRRRRRSRRPGEPAPLEQPSERNDTAVLAPPDEPDDPTGD